MSELQELRYLDVLADRLRDPAPSLEQRIQALTELQRGLAEFTSVAPSDSMRGANDQTLARAKKIAAMTQLGQLPELRALEGRLDADTMQTLGALCAQPMSRRVEDDFIGALDRATRTARTQAERLQELNRQVARDRHYRDLLRDMSDLLTLLVGRSPDETTPT
jgi:hypothetical protein